MVLYTYCTYFSLHTKQLPMSNLFAKNGYFIMGGDMSNICAINKLYFKHVK